MTLLALPSLSWSHPVSFASQTAGLSDAVDHQESIFPAKDEKASSERGSGYGYANIDRGLNLPGAEWRGVGEIYNDAVLQALVADLDRDAKRKSQFLRYGRMFEKKISEKLQTGKSGGAATIRLTDLQTWSEKSLSYYTRIECGTEGYPGVVSLSTKVAEEYLKMGMPADAMKWHTILGNVLRILHHYETAPLLWRDAQVGAYEAYQAARRLVPEVEGPYSIKSSQHHFLIKSYRAFLAELDRLDERKAVADQWKKDFRDTRTPPVAVVIPLRQPVPISSEVVMKFIAAHEAALPRDSREQVSRVMRGNTTYEISELSGAPTDTPAQRLIKIIYYYRELHQRPPAALMVDLPQQGSLLVDSVKRERDRQDAAAIETLEAQKKKAESKTRKGKDSKSREDGWGKRATVDLTQFREAK